jgi:hypothetical protein
VLCLGVIYVVTCKRLRSDELDVKMNRGLQRVRRGIELLFPHIVAGWLGRVGAQHKHHYS